MKAFLLAAGIGTRLKPFTDTQPKCLIPIHGTPLLKIWLDLLAMHGVTEVLINTHHHADQVERFVSGYGQQSPMKLHTTFEPQLLGSAGTVWRNHGFVDDQKDFIIAYADNLTDLDLAKMIDTHRIFRSMEGILTMGLIQAPDPTQCGIVTLDQNNRIIRFVEKPVKPESDLANGGVYITSSQLLDYYPDSADETTGVLDLGHHILPRLTGKMYGYRITDYLRDIGTPQAYRAALAEWPAAKASPRSHYGA